MKCDPHDKAKSYLNNFYINSIVKKKSYQMFAINNNYRYRYRVDCSFIMVLDAPKSKLFHGAYFDKIEFYIVPNKI